MEDVELLREVQKVVRERAALKAANISDALKHRLMSVMDAKLAALEAVLSPPKSEAKKAV